MNVGSHARVALRLALAHHPLCHWFSSDRIRVGPVAVCSGCLATWPAALLLLPAALRLPVAGEALAAGGLLLAAPQMASYARRAGRRWRFAAKAIGGAGLALLVAGLVRARLPLPWLAAAFVAMLAGFALLQAVRLRALLRTCDACPYQRDWEACPGFRATAAPPPRPSRPSRLPGSHQSRPKPLKRANDTSRRNAGPAHRG